MVTDLPEDSDFIKTNLAVVANQREALNIGLGDEHTIERVTVVERQNAGCAQMIDSDWQQIHRPCVQEVQDEVKAVSGEIETSLSLLDTDLPKCCETHKEPIFSVFEGGPHRRFETPIAFDEPQQSMRIEQEVHVY